MAIGDARLLITFLKETAAHAAYLAKKMPEQHNAVSYLSMLRMHLTQMTNLSRATETLISKIMLW